jgi:hypothetical protein
MPDVRYGATFPLTFPSLDLEQPELPADARRLLEGAQERRRSVGVAHNLDYTRGVLYDGTVPASWTQFINFGDAAQPFIKHEKFILRQSGSAVFSPSTLPGSPEEGEFVYTSATHQFQFWNGTGWVTIGSGTVGVASVQGTANQITASPITGDVILSLPSSGTLPGTWNAQTGFNVLVGPLIIGADTAFTFTLRINQGSAPLMVQNAGRIDVRSYNSSAAVDEKLTDVWSQDGASGAQTFSIGLARSDAAVLGHQSIVLFRSGNTWTTMRLMQSGGVVTVGTDPGGTDTFRVGGGGRFSLPVSIVRVGGEPSLDFQRDLTNNPHWSIARMNSSAFRFVFRDDVTTEYVGAQITASGGFSSLVVPTSSDGPFQGDAYTNTASAGATILGRRARVGPAAVAANDVLSGIYGAGYHSGAAFGGFVAAVRLLTEEGFTSGAQGSRIEFATTTIGTASRTARWRISNAGHLLGEADNTYDIGAAGATRPRSAYIGTSVRIGADFGATSLLQIGKSDGVAADMVHIRDTADGADFILRYDGGNLYQIFSESGGGGTKLLEFNVGGAGTVATGGDFIIGSLGRFDSADVPLDGQILFYHAGATNKWQAESLQLIYNAGDAAVALLADNTSTQFLYFDPGAGADSPVGAPPAPVLQLFATHKGVTVAAYASTAPDVFYHDGPSFPADFRHFIYEYSLDNFATAAVALATASSDKVNHGRLTVGTTYYYRVRAVDRAGNASANSAVVSFVAAANSDTSNFGVVLATEIAVDRLAALSANIGVITAGQMRNAGNTTGVNLGGAGGIPGTWTSGINFEAAAGSGSMTRYINFTATGSNPVFKHEKMSLNADGSASFTGSLLVESGDGTDLLSASSTVVLLQSDAETAGVNVIGTLPGGWTRYLNLNGSGTFLKHDKLELKYDGTATFGGLIDITAAGGDVIIIRTTSLTHGMTSLVATDISGRVKNTNAAAGGLQLEGFTDATDLSAVVIDGMNGQATSPVNGGVLIRGWKKSGTTRGAFAASEPVVFVFNSDATKLATFFGDGTLKIEGNLSFADAVSKIIPGATSLSLRNTADSADNILITDAGVVTLRNNLLFATDNSFDIGAAGANRPRDIRIGGNYRSTDGSAGIAQSVSVPGADAQTYNFTFKSGLLTAFSIT